MVETRESVTAKLCSFARAFHSNIGKNKIFDDYLAYDLMGRDEYEEIGQLIQNDFDEEKSDKNFAFASDKITKCLNRYITPIPLSRIAFAESELNAFARRHGKCQYVICGAGMDTFAFRNDNPKIKVFELDHPDTGRYKRRRIKELEWNIPDNLTFVPIDFSKWVSCFLSVFEETIRKISSLCSAESKVVFDYPDETTLHGKSTERVHTLAHITEKLGEKMLHGYSYKEVFTVLERHGFEIEEHETPQMIQLRYFKNRSDMAAFENINFILACKEKIPGEVA